MIRHTAFWRTLQWVLFFLILAGLFAIVMRYRSALEAITWEPTLLLPFLLISLLCILSRALLVGELAAYFNVRLRFIETLGLTVVSTTLSESLPVSAGTFLRPAYLWRVHQLPISASLTMVVINSLMITGASSALAMLGLVVLGHTVSGLMAFFSGLFFLSITLFFLTPWLGKGLSSRLAPIASSWSSVLAKPSTSSRVMLLSIVVCALDALRLWLAFLLIGKSIAFGAAVVLMAAALFMAYFVIVPGALGFVEALVVSIAASFGYDPLYALTSALIFRAGILIYVVPATPIFYFRLLRAMETGPRQHPGS